MKTPNNYPISGRNFASNPEITYSKGFLAVGDFYLVFLE